MEITSTKNRLYTFIHAFFFFTNIKQALFAWQKRFGWSYLCWHLIISIKSAITGKLAHYPFQQWPVCVDHTFVGWAAQLRSGWGPQENVPNFLPLKKTASYSLVGIDSFVLSCLGDWMMISHKEQQRHICHLLFYLLNKIRRLSSKWKNHPIPNSPAPPSHAGHQPGHT